MTGPDPHLRRIYASVHVERLQHSTSRTATETEVTVEEHGRRNHIISPGEVRVKMSK